MIPFGRSLVLRCRVSCVEQGDKKTKENGRRKRSEIIFVRQIARQIVRIDRQIVRQIDRNS